MTTALNATADDVRNTAEALKLAAVLDDRVTAGDKARIAAWAEQIHRHNLIRSDLLDGLQAFYDNPSANAIQIGDLIQHARIVKNRRLERESDAERDARRELADTKAADMTHALAGAALTGPTKNRTARLERAEMGLQVCEGKTESIAALREYFAANSGSRDRQNPTSDQQRAKPVAGRRREWVSHPSEARERGRSA
ncbi:MULTISPECIES: hypothetical protein [unclassified Mycobacterium]|uniref:hypothetical protein n=1 Tax=unclassified Mycobacterium TaxID=2642494 RepID=UPI0008008FCA|nr:MULTISPECIES: hypothetical protein [unclassified Mycobacterium]OBG72059.1 hypothetical protein A5700_00795 [Mycobacterium sp. E1214]OBH24700.1 hypothetical protein A5693_07385 [Mycobacterium sp. E1319]